jgi:hypothetical protein
MSPRVLGRLSFFEFQFSRQTVYIYVSNIIHESSSYILAHTHSWFSLRLLRQSYRFRLAVGRKDRMAMLPVASTLPVSNNTKPTVITSTPDILTIRILCCAYEDLATM